MKPSAPRSQRAAVRLAGNVDALNIDWLIPCRYVEVHDNLATIVGAGIDTYWQTELPATIAVMLALRLVGLPDEFTEEEEHTTATRIKDPRGGTISELKGGARIGAESANPDFLAAVTLGMAVQFEAAEVGTYAIELDFDAATKSVPIHVVLAEADD